MSENLERYLKDLDEGFETDPGGEFTFEQVVRTAQKNHIRVQAIDSMASYRSTGMTPADNHFRQKMMNYFAHEVISADQIARGSHRWVALMGNSHANTYEGVAGVSELEGSIGLRIEDVDLDELTGIKVDPGVSDEARPGRAAGFAKNDLLLQIKTPQSVILARRLNSGLPNAGMYTLDTSTDQALLIHRSSDIEVNGLLKKGPIVRTPVLRDRQGFYIKRESWPWISGIRFARVAGLSGALDRHGMTLVRLSDV
jgi:hypothetical protein